MNFSVNELCSAFIRGVLRDEAGVGIPSSNFSAVTVTLYDKNTGNIINSRNHASILNINGGSIDSLGNFAWEMTPNDNAILDDSLSIENHVALIEFTYSGGRMGKAEVQIGVVNLVKVPDATPPPTIGSVIVPRIFDAKLSYTESPVIAVLYQNDMYNPVTVTRINTGNYRLNCVDFVSGLTSFTYTQSLVIEGDLVHMGMQQTVDGQIQIRTYDESFALVDADASGLIFVRVYSPPASESVVIPRILDAKLSYTETPVVACVYQNDMHNPVTVTRINTGNYRLNCIDFVNGKTSFTHTQSLVMEGGMVFVGMQQTVDGQIQIRTYDETFALVDADASGLIFVRVYT